MASTVADVAGLPAEQAPATDLTHDVAAAGGWPSRRSSCSGAVLGSLFLGHPQPLPRRVRQRHAGHRALAPLRQRRHATARRTWRSTTCCCGAGPSSATARSRLRSLSVILAVGALWVVIMLARSLFGRRAALLAGLLLAVNPLFIQFAQDVRGYSLALLLVSASCFFFVRGIQQVDPPPRFCWTAYTDRHRPGGLHATSGPRWSRSAQALSLAFLPPGRIPWRRILASAVALVVLLVPLGLLIRVHRQRRRRTGPSGSSAGRLFTHIRSSVPHAVLDLLVLIAAVAVVAVVVLARRRPAVGDGLRPPVAGCSSPRVGSSCRWRAVVMLSLVDKPLARRALPDGQPARGRSCWSAR